MPRVLIIDDHPVVREGIGRVLTSSLPDVDIGEADGAGQAQKMMHARSWDLVMLDLTLEGDDGTVILRRLRQSHPDVPETDANEQVLAAAEGCPVEAITLTLLDSGEVVFPPED